MLSPLMYNSPKINTSKMQDNYAGQLLIAQPKCKSGFFSEAVILMVEHSTHGAWGLQINKEVSTIKTDTLAQTVGVELTEEHSKPVLLGGPVETTSLHFIHTPECVMSSTIEINEGLCVTSDPIMFHELRNGRGPAKWKLVMGVSGWTGEQLEGEMSGQHPWTKEHRWLTLPAPNRYLLDLDVKSMWKGMVTQCVEQATANFF